MEMPKVVDFETRVRFFDEAMKNIVTPEFRQYLINEGFFTAPASTKYHGSKEGGLFDHSFTVMSFLMELSAKEGLKWSRKESPLIIGMFHDLCKIDCYLPIIDPETKAVSYKFNTDTLLKGHGDKSVMLLSSKIQLTEEEVMCIRYHMGAFTDKEEWNDYTGAIHKFPNVLWTHQADMLASHVAGI